MHAGDTPPHPSDRLEQGRVSRGDFYVYQHFRRTTGEVFYVGKGTGDRAWKAGAGKRGLHWRNIARRHGVVVEIAASGLREWYAHELECHLIALHGRRQHRDGPLVNLTDGGEGASGVVRTTEYRAKHKAVMQRLAQDPEWRAKLKAAAQRLAQNPEWRAKNKAAAQRLYQDPEYRAKNKAAAQRRAQDPEYRARNKAAVQRRAQDPEWRAKMTTVAQALRGKEVLMCSTGRLFPSASDAARWLQENGHSRACQSSISQAARGLKKTTYGSQWIYVEDLA